MNEINEYSSQVLGKKFMNLNPSQTISSRVDTAENQKRIYTSETKQRVKTQENKQRQNKLQIKTLMNFNQKQQSQKDENQSNLNFQMDFKKEIKTIRQDALKKIDFKSVENEMDIFFKNEQQKLQEKLQKFNQIKTPLLQQFQNEFDALDEQNNEFKNMFNVLNEQYNNHSYMIVKKLSDVMRFTPCFDCIRLNQGHDNQNFQCQSVDIKPKPQQNMLFLNKISLNQLYQILKKQSFIDNYYSNNKNFQRNFNIRSQSTTGAMKTSHEFYKSDKLGKKFQTRDAIDNYFNSQKKSQNIEQKNFGGGVDESKKDNKTIKTEIFEKSTNSQIQQQQFTPVGFKLQSKDQQKSFMEFQVNFTQDNDKQYMTFQVKNDDQKVDNIKIPFDCNNPPTVFLKYQQYSGNLEAQVITSQLQNLYNILNEQFFF